MLKLSTAWGKSTMLLLLSSMSFSSHAADCSGDYLKTLESGGIHSLLRFFSDEKAARTPLSDIQHIAGDLSAMRLGSLSDTWSAQFKQSSFRLETASDYTDRRYIFFGNASNNGLFRLELMQRIEGSDCELYGVAFQYR